MRIALTSLGLPQDRSCVRATYFPNLQEGVRHVLALLRAELELAMALAGRLILASIDRSLVRRGQDFL